VGPTPVRFGIVSLTNDSDFIELAGDFACCSISKPAT
jgi:hypothetical protein